LVEWSIQVNIMTHELITDTFGIAEYLSPTARGALLDGIVKESWVFAHLQVKNKSRLTRMRLVEVPS
jgi:hypothetical protein